MLAIIEEKLDVVRELCVTYHVKRLELFGSAAQDRPAEQPNDLDFLVEFLSMPPVEYADCYFGLLEALEETFGYAVDLAEISQLKNPYFLEVIRPARTVLYAA